MRGRNDKRCEDLVCLEDIMPTCLDAAGAPIPPSVEGRSLLPLMKGEASPGREWLHGEHATCYGVHHAHHYLVGKKEKYIWFSHSGKEQLFDLQQDPQEKNDLANEPTKAEHLAIWRGRLIQDLDRRPEGFTKSGSLQAGRRHQALLPSLA
jgi:arylsulfatase A-like enzyme